MKLDPQSDSSSAITAKIEPLVLPEGSRQRGDLTELAFDLSQKSAALRHILPPALLASIGSLVQAANGYFSNLIEGHDAPPAPFLASSQTAYDGGDTPTDLQVEAEAHMAVQQWIDTGALHGGRAASVAGLREIHQRFSERLPERFRWFDHPATGARTAVVPGALRDWDAQTGRDLPARAQALPAFLGRFEQAYAPLGKADRIVATPAAHHRLLWLRPFVSANGRVARLMSHAMLADALGAGMVWSVARGLAHHLGQYRAALASCDQPRRHGLDGRGHLSEEALVELTRLFLGICLEQVTFMERLLQPERLRARIMLWAEEEIRLGLLSPRSGSVLEAVLYRGELPRGDAEAIVGTGARHARRMVAALVERGVLTSDSQRAPLRLAIPMTLVGRWTPGLFPEKIA